jgi:rSAM/selenodomain-associated transferase 1
MHPDGNALLVFAKQPTPGRVKTRLTPTLLPAEAAKLYHCMLQDTLTKAKSLAGAARFIFYVDEDGAADYFRGIAPGAELFPQEGETLGDRMENAFARAFARSFQRVAIIGTDSPDLPPGFIESAFALLGNENVDVVFGPAEDGGYYLLAMKRLHGELFRGISWSSGSVLADSLARCAAAGLTVELLPVWYDLDTVEDLQRPALVAELTDAPLTRAFIRTNSSLLQRGAVESGATD